MGEEERERSCVSSVGVTMTQSQKQCIEGKTLTHRFMGLKSIIVGDLAVGAVSILVRGCGRESFDGCR